MYQALNLHCIFHKTNNSQWRQDVVATPHTTTLICTGRVQAKTDVDDLKMDIWGKQIRWEMKFPMGLHLFRMDGWCLFQVVVGAFTIVKPHVLKMNSKKHTNACSKIISKSTLCNNSESDATAVKSKGSKGCGHLSSPE